MVLPGDHKFVAEALLGWSEAGLIVRLVRGRKMRTAEGLFDEVSAALQFPYYFGENWSAFDECLTDMDWLPSTAGLVVIVLDSGEVLCDEPDEELGTLVRVIGHAAETYAEPVESGEWWDRPALPFHVVLHIGVGEEASMRAHWGAAGAKFSDLN